MAHNLRIRVEGGSMAYKVNYHGYDVECDTVEDLRMLLNHNGDITSQPAVASNARVGLDKTVVSELVAKLRDEQRELLRIVASKGPITRQDLSHAVGASDPHEFVGL